ncbi:MAG: hypothetical protein ACE5IZ_00220 [Dehalococcoidia bacterium]
MAQESASLSGQSRWRLHQETVDRFWERVEAFLRSFDARQLKLYQDGLAAAGDVGRQVVQAAARRGSRNYQLLLKLVDSGAELRKTEDIALLLQERESLLALLQQGPAPEAQRDSRQYRRQRERLLEERDRFIADTINATLTEEDLGALFIGAYHDVASRLEEDISVEPIKDPEKVRAYFVQLFLEEDDEGLQELARYLAAPVTPP